MKATNDMIDKVTEVCMDVALKTDTFYEDVLRDFLHSYLGAPRGRLSLTMDNLKQAKRHRSQEQWQEAYKRWCLIVYGKEEA